MRRFTSAPIGGDDQRREEHRRRQRNIAQPLARDRLAIGVVEHRKLLVSEGWIRRWSLNDCMLG